MNLDSLLKRIKRLSLQLKSYGFSGNYASWHDALKHSKGYDNEDIFKKVLESTLAVQQGKAAFERDSVVFEKPEYDWFLLSALMYVNNADNKLNIADVGGAMGSLYFQHKKLLNNIKSLNWHVVEQTKMVELAKEHVIEPNLTFHDSLTAVLNESPINLVILKCVLPYLENPYQLLEEILRAKPAFLLIDRTPFIDGPDRLTVQKVPSYIVSSSYPAWFFNKDKMLDFLNVHYELVMETFNQEHVNIECSYDGMLFKKRS